MRTSLNFYVWIVCMRKRDECKQFESVQGRKKMEINVRAVGAFREVGKGHEAFVNVARCMNMFSITETAFTAINDSLQRDL